MRKRLLAFTAFALLAQAEDPGRRAFTVTVREPFIERAQVEAELDHLIRLDLIDAGQGMMNWQTRKRIRALSIKLESEE